MSQNATDYELTLTVKNAPFLNMMRENGYENIAQLAKASGVCREGLDRLARLERGVYHKDGVTPSKPVQMVADFFGCHIEELVPASHIRTPLKQAKFVAQVAEEQMREIAQSAQDPAKLLEIFETESRDAFSDMLDGVKGELNPRHRRVIEMRFRDNMTYRECAEEMGISSTRVRHIELTVLRRLRHPVNSDSGSDLIKASGMYADLCGRGEEP